MPRGNKATLEWQNPREDETGSEFCRRMGWKPGDYLVHSISADKWGNPDKPRKYKILELDVTYCGSTGYVRVRSSNGDSLMGMVSSGLRVTWMEGCNIRRRTTTWPWAKVYRGWRERDA